MALKRIGYAVLGLILLAVFGGVCVLATSVTHSAAMAQQTQETVVPETELYRNQGLEPGLELDGTPDEITPEQVIFSDRILLRSQWTQEELTHTLDELRAFLSQVQLREPNVQSYLMTVPLRIGLEGSFSTDADYLALVQEELGKLRSLEDLLLSSLEDLATPVPILETLLEHQSEYLFYRTDSAWTARGAYYGGQAFLSAAGLETFPIESFQESAKSTTTGSFAPEKNFTGLEDRQYVYLYENYNPLVERLGIGERAPMVSVIRGASGCFLGASHYAYLVDGLADNGRSLMLMGAGNASVLAPWMVTQFDTILYIDLSFYSLEDMDLWEAFSQYGITDLLIVGDTSTLSSWRIIDIYEDLARAQ